MTPAHPGLDTPLYERFRALILERSGLHFPDKRRQDLERGLTEAMGRSGCTSAEAYYQLLAGKPTGGPEWESLIGQVTIGETYFFRDRGQFEALRQRILPAIIAEKRALTRQIRIWSAGCASGEEPYSIAMVLRELLPDLSSWSVTLLATDINREVLQKARAGRYGGWSFREDGWERLRERYFARHGKEWHLAPEVREMVTFAYLNLGEDPYPSMANNTVAFDLILCRNVTIYFAPDLVRHVVDRFYEALVEGGWLVVGHSEPSPVTYTQFEAQTFPGTILYRKTGRPARFDVSWLATVEKPPVPAVPKIEPLPVAAKPAPPARVLPPPPPAPKTCDGILALLDAGRTEEALEQLHQALERDPKCATAYFLVGKIRANAGMWQEARRWFEQALQLDPLLMEGHFLLSLVHSQEGNQEEALASMKRVVYLDRNAILGHFCLANLYQEVGNLSRARKSLENTAHLLQGMSEDAVIPWSDGMTAGRLGFTVHQQMREWENLDKRHPGAVSAGAPRGT
jgi:chemotaxis protein methyltransferase CheR